MIARGISGNLFSLQYKHLVGIWVKAGNLQLRGSAEGLLARGAGEFVLQAP